MSPTFFNAKMVYRTEGRGAFAPRCRSFSPIGGRLRPEFSGRAQIGQPFEVPTDALELQFQSVGFVSHIPHPPVACAPLPPAEHLFNLAPDRTEQPVRPEGRRAQLLSPAGLGKIPLATPC